MKKINEDSCHPNDLPVIFEYDHQGNVIGKISINDWKAKKEEAEKLNEIEIKLYRESINYYTNKEFKKAEDLLLFLIKQTDFTHYEYIERLANLYRRQANTSKEKELLLKARKNMSQVIANEGIIRRIDKRLEKNANVTMKGNLSLVTD